MSDLRDLYQEIILDHNRNPRNFKKLEGADRTAEGYNPLCGDHYTVYLNLDGDKIREVTFHGTGCAISKASASVMTNQLKGKNREEAERLFEGFRDMVTGKLPEEDADKLGKLAAFNGVKEHPSRIKCAILAWHAVHSALASEGENVSTE
jgi:nitrogen fixation NifU-like protein